MLQITPTQALAFVLLQEYLGTLLPGSMTSDLRPFFRMARQRLADAASGGAGRHWRERVRIIPPSQPLIAPKVVPAVHAAVTDALLKDCKLAITYRSRGAAKARNEVVHPLGLVQRGALLYRVVVFDGYDDVRMVAIHRISAAEVLPERAGRPQGFDLADYVQKGFVDFGSGKSIRLEALFEEDATIALAESPLSEDQVLGPPKGGMVRLTATVTETPQLKWWLFGFGGPVEVVKPAGLRAQMVEIARAMGARYKL